MRLLQINKGASKTIALKYCVLCHIKQVSSKFNFIKIDFIIHSLAMYFRSFIVLYSAPHDYISFSTLCEKQACVNSFRLVQF